MKIEKLTPEQEDLISIVRDEWINFSLSGDTSIDKQKAIDGVNWAYNLAKHKSPKFIVFAEGPMAAQFIANVFPDVCKAIPIKLNSASVRDSVRDSVGDSVWDSVGASVWDSVRDSVRDSVGDSVKTKKLSHKLSWNGLCADAGWNAFYDYFMRIGLKHDLFCKYRDWIKSGIWECLWFKDLCIVVCRPSEINKNKKGQFHCSKGPAAKWPSGEVYWFLNDIRVNEKIVLHPEQLSKEEILGEKDVDVRREMLRQIGMERFTILTNPKVLDKQGDYELLSIDLSDNLKDCRFLKMKNPSMAGVIHVEGVERECDTVQAAINWRAGDIKKKWEPIQLT